MKRLFFVAVALAVTLVSCGTDKGVATTIRGRFVGLKRRTEEKGDPCHVHLPECASAYLGRAYELYRCDFPHADRGIAAAISAHDPLCRAR